ncbi:MAG: glycosyltransferase [Gammaproteobacteria bacterium]|nr:MAG: glycosyltransferase [Gammaproteobacteria bacterium]
MKVLWVSHLVPYPPKAGVLLRSHHLLKELSKYHEVDLIAFNQRGLMEPYFETYEEGTTEAKSFLTSICKRVNIFDCPTDGSSLRKMICAATSLISRFPYTVNWLDSRDFQQTINTMHKENQYDLIHFDTIGLMPYWDPAMRNAAISLDHHNVESHMLFRRASLEKNWIKKFYYFQEGVRVKSLEKKYCKLVDTNITCSDLDSARFIDFVHSNNFITIPNGVDINAFKPGKAYPDTNKLLFIGTLDWYPNIRAVRFLAFDLWRALKSQLPQMVMDIVGARPPHDIVEFGKQNQDFNVHGFVNDIDPYFEKALIYLCPINDGGGTKLKVIDALASGKAVIADPIACEGLGVTDGVNILFATSVDEYITKIRFLMDNPDIRVSIEKNARDHAVNYFSFSSIGNKLAQHYESVAKLQAKGER